MSAYYYLIIGAIFIILVICGFCMHNSEESERIQIYADTYRKKVNLERRIDGLEVRQEDSNARIEELEREMGKLLVRMCVMEENAQNTVKLEIEKERIQRRLEEID